MVDTVEVGMRLHAKYTDGEFYLAEVLAVSTSPKRAKAPVKVTYIGNWEEEQAWLAVSDLKSKKLAKSAPAKAASVPKVDVSSLTKGLKLQAQAEDDKWYLAEVLAVNKKRSTVKVNYVGYTAASDEWIAADRVRSKALAEAKPKAKAKVKAKAKAESQGPKEPKEALQIVPILKQIKTFAGKEKSPAVVETSGKTEKVVISYKELLANVVDNSKIVASLLAGRAEGTPKHVAYLINPSIAYVVTELSVWAAGAACVPLSVHSPAPELEYYIENSEAQLLIADTASVEKLKPVAEKLSRTIATITTSGELKYAISTGSDIAEGDVDTKCMMTSTALMLYTSGTTGKPKGVVHTFRSLSAQYMSLRKAWKWTEKDYTLHVLPLHHIHGVQNILNTAMYSGAGVEFTPFDAGFCLDRIGSGDVTCFHAVPTIYVKFTQFLEKADAATNEKIRAGLRNESLRYMVSGSAALPVPTMKSWAEISGHVLLERYGMTEIGMGLSNKIDDTRFPGCVGWALPQVKVKKDDEGAILIKGPCLFKEYYKLPEATAKEFTDGGWFKTGDACQVGGTEEELQKVQDDAREVEAATGRPRPETAEKAIPELAKIYKIMGRSSVDIIKSGGYKISALEIESVLLQHEKIKECAVVGKPDETWGEKVTAVCVLNGELTIKELREWGKERLASYKVPQELEAVEELPRNQMGKLEKKKILDKYKK